MSTVIKKRLTDSKKLERLGYTGPKGRIMLFEQFSKPNGRFCDMLGNIEPTKVRHVYMLAGMIPPKNDEDILDEVAKDVELLNAFLEHSGTRDTRKLSRSPKKVMNKSPKRQSRNGESKKPL